MRSLLHYVCWGLVVVVVLEGALAALTRAAIATLAGSAIAIATRTGSTVATLTTRTRFSLYIALGLGCQYSHRQTIFAGLLVDLDELDIHLVALFQTARFHVLETLPRDLADVEKSVATRHKFYECTEVED